MQSYEFSSYDLKSTPINCDINLTLINKRPFKGHPSLIYKRYL